MYKVSHESDRFIYCYCPYHKDTNRANLIVNKVENNGRPRGYYYCMACGKWGRLSEQEVTSIAKKETVFMGTSRYSGHYANIDWNTLACDFMCRWLELSEDEQLLPKAWGVAPIVLDWFGIGYEPVGKYFTFPMFNEKREVIGIQLRKETGKKLSIEGSKLGLFMPTAWGWQIKETIYITEGVSDAAVALHCTGAFVIGKPCATSGNELIRDFLQEEKYRGKIIIISDSDYVGIKSSTKLVGVLKDWDVKVKTVNPYKDLRAFHQAQGKAEVRRLLGCQEESEI